MTKGAKMTDDNRIAVTQILESGEPDGIVKVSLTDWNGFCFRFPRRLISKAKTFQELIDNPAVYLLFGEENTKPVCYVGESDDPITRMSQHNEDYWNEALIFVGSKDFPLSKAKIKYLENELYSEAVKASSETGRYVIKNGNTPKKSPLSDSEQIHANEFLKHVMVICSVLGYKVFDYFLPKEELLDNQDDLFYISKEGIDAVARRTNEGLVVLKGSKVANGFTEKTTQCFKDRGRDLRESGVIVDDCFSRDYLFKSPSGAAVVVVGHNANGRTEWKRKDGKTIKTLEDEGK